VAITVAAEVVQATQRQRGDSRDPVGRNSRSTDGTRV
jgi:hypothetical protein